MAKKWTKDKEWSDRFIPEIQRILGETFFCLPSLADDQMKNTDLICLDINMNGKRIGCRIRKNKYLMQYPFQFTIRCSRPMGTKTEYQKITEGWGDYFFYGFSDKTETILLLWFVGNLSVFRDIISGSHRGQIKQNIDNSSDFIAFNWQEMPPEFFVKISEPSLLMSSFCDTCLCRKVQFENSNTKKICPKCSTLYDYTGLLERHKKARNFDKSIR